MVSNSSLLPLPRVSATGGPSRRSRWTSLPPLANADGDDDGALFRQGPRCPGSVVGDADQNADAPIVRVGPPPEGGLAIELEDVAVEVDEVASLSLLKPCSSDNGPFWIVTRVAQKPGRHNLEQPEGQNSSCRQGTRGVPLGKFRAGTRGPTPHTPSPPGPLQKLMVLSPRGGPHPSRRQGTTGVPLDEFRRELGVPHHARPRPG